MSTATTNNKPKKAVPQTSDGVAIKRKSNWGPGTIWSVVAWVAGIVFFFPVLWMVLTGFKQEADAYSDPPKLFFTPTLDQYRGVLDSGIGTALLNSAFATIVSTLLVLLLGVPAAFALSLRPVKKTKDVLFFFISTKVLPVVAAIVPLYVIVGDIGEHRFEQARRRCSPVPSGHRRADLGAFSYVRGSWMLSVLPRTRTAAVIDP